MKDNFCLKTEFLRLLDSVRILVERNIFSPEEGAEAFPAAIKNWENKNKAPIEDTVSNAVKILMESGYGVYIKKE